jgi:hypothetical protein
VDGYRYLSSAGAMFLQQLLVLVLLALEGWRFLLLIADGARWIRMFFTETLSQIPTTTMILDWCHLHQKCIALCDWGAGSISAPGQG